MTLTLTDRNSVVTQAIVDLLKNNWEVIGCPGPDDIYYGDQSRYPRTPSIAVEPTTQPRELNQTGLQQRIQFSIYIFVYHGPVKRTEVRKKEIDEIAERTVGVLHTDRRLNGLVIHGHPTSVEPGFVSRGGTLQEVHRILWEGISNHTMP
jgi:hypothetical protein